MGKKLTISFLIPVGLQVDGLNMFWAWNGYYYEVLKQTNEVGEYGGSYEIVALSDYPKRVMQNYSLRQRIRVVSPFFELTGLPVL